MQLTESRSVSVLPANQGRAIWFLDTLSLIKVTGEQTGGAFAQVEQILPAGSRTPYHIHYREDESVYLIEGEATFFTGERRLTAKAGSVIFLPRGIPHGFRIERPSRTLVLAAPAGFEDFVCEAGREAPQRILPPDEPPNPENLTRIAARYGIEILGPLPE